VLVTRVYGREGGGKRNQNKNTTNSTVTSYTFAFLGGGESGSNHKAGEEGETLKEGGAQERRTRYSAAGILPPSEKSTDSAHSGLMVKKTMRKRGR